MGVNTQNMYSCLQKYNKLNRVASFWTIIKLKIKYFTICKFFSGQEPRAQSYGHQRSSGSVTQEEFLDYL